MTTNERAPVAPHDLHAQIDTYVMMSLIFGVIWLGGAGSVIAVVLGHKALNSMKLIGDRSNRGLAIVGCVLSWLGIAAIALVLLILLITAGTLGGAGTPY